MNKEFAVHMLNAQGRMRAAAIAESFDLLLETLMVKLSDGPMCPEGREFAIVRSRLEEACFYAKKSMAMMAANQERAPAKAEEIPNV